MAPSRSVRFGPFLVDKTRKVLLRGDEEVLRAGNPFKVLAYLVTRPGEVVSRDDLMEAIWPDEHVEDQSLTQAISDVRKALEDHRNLIRTHRRAYEFVGEIRKEEDAVRTRSPLKILANRGELDTYLDKVALASTASEIDMLGWNLYRQWFDNPSFVDALDTRLREKRNDLKLRVLLPDPTATFMQAIAHDLGNLPSASAHRAKWEAEDFLARYDKTWVCVGSLPETGILRTLENEAVLCGVVRFDAVMAVSLYTHPPRGRTATSLLLNMKQRKRDEISVESEQLFEKLKKMFNKMWRRAG